jgi:molybdopterin synthase catalytic subunit
MVPSILVKLQHEPLSVDQAVGAVSHSGAGAVALFLGVVRNENAGKPVTLLEYEAYASMAEGEMQRIAEEIQRELPMVGLCALHRVGPLHVGDVAVICAGSAPHRSEAFKACRMLIDRIKARVPIWKREHGPAGAYWVDWVDARCGDDHDSDDSNHDHDTAHSH